MGGLDSVTEFHALTQPLLDLFLNPANGLDSQFDWFRELIVLDIQVERRPWNTSEFTHARESQYFHVLHLEGVSYRGLPPRIFILHREFFREDSPSVNVPAHAHRRMQTGAYSSPLQSIEGDKPSEVHLHT